MSQQNITWLYGKWKENWEKFILLLHCILHFLSFLGVWSESTGKCSNKVENSIKPYRLQLIKVFLLKEMKTIILDCFIPAILACCHFLLFYLFVFALNWVFISECFLFSTLWVCFALNYDWIQMKEWTIWIKKTISLSTFKDKHKPNQIHTFSQHCNYTKSFQFKKHKTKASSTVSFLLLHDNFNLFNTFLYKKDKQKNKKWITIKSRTIWMTEIIISIPYVHTRKSIATGKNKSFALD